MVRNGSPGWLGSLFRAHPWMAAVVSAGFLVIILWGGTSVGWDPWAPMGRGLKRLPLWLMVSVGVPFFATGVVVGVVLQWRLLRRKPQAPPGPSLELEQLRRDGPGWLSRRAGVDDTVDDSVSTISTDRGTDDSVAVEVDQTPKG
jgi:hypothetical protein